MADPLASYEVLRDTRSQRWLGQNYKGRRIFRIPTAELETLRASFKPAAANKWPETVPGIQAYIQEHAEERDYWPNYTRVESLYYRPATAGRLLRDNVGKGILEVDTSGFETRILKELYGAERLIEGPDPGAPDKRWIVIGGSNTALLPACALRLTLMTAALIPTATMDLIGTFNAEQLTHWGPMPADRIRFDRAVQRLELDEAQLYKTVCLFTYSPVGWEGLCAVEQEERVKREDEDHVEFYWEPVPDTEDERNTTRGPGDFEVFDDMMDWS